MGTTYRLHLLLSISLCLPVMCCSCKAVSDSYEAFLDVPLDIKVRGFLTVLQDVPSSLWLPRMCAAGLEKCTVNTGELGGRWEVVWEVSCKGHGSGLPAGAGQAHIILSALRVSQPPSLCLPSTPTWLLGWWLVLFSFLMTLHTIGS